MLRAFAFACTLMAAWSIALGVSSCSLLLDWNGYTGGDLPGHDAAEERDDDANDAADAPDLDAHDDARQDAKDEANGDVQDVQVVEAAPPCSPAHCGGCCNTDGFCAGGESQDTCGMGGMACQNCKNAGLSCSMGTCSSSPPPIDSGPPPVCALADCMNMFRCAPVYQSACCKTDGTCGCRVMIPPMPACN